MKGWDRIRLTRGDLQRCPVDLRGTGSGRAEVRHRTANHTGLAMKQLLLGGNDERQGAGGPIRSLTAKATILVGTLTIALLGNCGRSPLGVGASNSVDGYDDTNLIGVVCGGQTCPAGQVCCVLDGTCVDPATASDVCSKPDASQKPAREACGSNADCQTDEFCAPEVGCLGPGVCFSRANCGSSTGAELFCGCDGKNYASIQAACLVGIKTSGHPGACGVTTPTDTSGPPTRDPVTFCGLDAQCPEAQKCCAISGRCYDALFPLLCSVPPPGTLAPCLEDRQCDLNEFCEGAGCSGPGGCVFQGGLCDGTLSPVCGCDGATYVSRSCTIPAGVRVLHDGACADGGTDQ
jgi:hypothetical protein